MCVCVCGKKNKNQGQVIHDITTMKKKKNSGEGPNYQTIISRHHRPPQ